MHTIQLSDYLVPVLYQTSLPHIEQYLEATTGLGFGRFVASDLAGVLKSILPPTLIPKSGFDAERHYQSELLGRDIDVLQLENLLSIQKMIMMHGQGGCGKTALLKYCCKWRKSSGWIDNVAYLDLESFRGRSVSFEDVLRSIYNQIDVSPESQSQYDLANLLHFSRCLLVLDSVECLSTPSVLDLIIFTPESLDQFQVLPGRCF